MCNSTRASNGTGQTALSDSLSLIGRPIKGRTLSPKNGTGQMELSDR